MVLQPARLWNGRFQQIALQTSPDARACSRREWRKDEQVQGKLRRSRRRPSEVWQRCAEIVHASDDCLGGFQILMERSRGRCEGPAGRVECLLFRNTVHEPRQVRACKMDGQETLGETET